MTVTGPGGVGKTRLAAEVARRVADRFADGAWLVELAAVRESALVPAAVAVALGISQPPGRSIADSLAGALARRQLLLVLDNCEHVLGAVAELGAALLLVADDVQVLATSREPVGIAGEARYRLPPLGLPGQGEHAEADGSESVALFAERARQVDPHFSMSRESAAQVARLVTRLDGVPLAIELAAARVESLGVVQLLERLDDRFRILVGPDRLAAPRQRSLAATVDWSYQLLSEQEQQVFRRLAIVPGPFVLEAAEVVAGATAGPMVLHLVDCSLLAPPRPGLDGRARYLMLESLRVHGLERLAEAGEQPAAAAALARYALGVAEHAACGLATSTGELAAARWLDAEDSTMHQSLAWALEHDPNAALRLAVALAPWWQVRGRSSAGYSLLDAAAEHAARGGEAWCTAQAWLGSLAPGPSETTSLEHFTAARDALAARAPSLVLVRALTGRAACLGHLDRLPEAADDALQALAMARELGDPAGEARALYWLAAVASYSGDHGSSLAWIRQTQQIDPANLPGTVVRGCCNGLTIALLEVGDVPSARTNCALGLALARQAGDLGTLAECLMLTADLELLASHVSGARTHLREAMDLASRTGSHMILIDCLAKCGYLCAATRRWDDAITVWSAHSACLQERGAPDAPQDLQRRQESLQSAQQALGPAQTRSAEERGAAMSLETAAEFAAMLTISDPEATQEPRGDTRLSAPPRRWHGVAERQPGRVDVSSPEGRPDPEQRRERAPDQRRSLLSPARLPRGGTADREFADLRHLQGPRIGRGRCHGGGDSVR